MKKIQLKIKSLKEKVVVDLEIKEIHQWKRKVKIERPAWILVMEKKKSQRIRSISLAENEVDPKIENAVLLGTEREANLETESGTSPGIEVVPVIENVVSLEIGNVVNLQIEKEINPKIEKGVGPEIENVVGLETENEAGLEIENQVNLEVVNVANQQKRGGVRLGTENVADLVTERGEASREIDDDLRKEREEADPEIKKIIDLKKERRKSELLN